VISLHLECSAHHKAEEDANPRILEKGSEETKVDGELPVQWEKMKVVGLVAQDRAG